MTDRIGSAIPSQLHFEPEGPVHETQERLPSLVRHRHAAAGTWQFLPFLREHGLDLRLFVRQLFANPVSGFFGMDVIVSSIVLWVFVSVEGRRSAMTHLWAPIAASLTVGVSLGLPLFLYMREAQLERSAPPRRSV